MITFFVDKKEVAILWFEREISSRAKIKTIPHNCGVLRRMRYGSSRLNVKTR